MVDVSLRYRLDSSYQRPGNGRVVVAGSPLRLFRLGAGGVDAVAAIERGEAPPPSATPLVDRLVEAGALHPRPHGSPFTAADVTMVTPTFNADVRLRHAGPMIVVDDASTVPVAAPPAATIIRSDVNGGPGAARQASRPLVTTPLVAFVDSDVRLPDGWLDPLLAHFSDARCALAAPRVGSAAGRSRLSRYEQLHSPLDLGAEPARIAPTTRVSYVPAAAMLCRVAALDEIGWFDTSLRRGEDVDLVWRLADAGWRCRYEPSSTVAHEPRPTWRAWAVQRVRYGSAAAPLARRHPGKLAPARLSGWSLALWASLALRRPLAAAALFGYTTLALRRRLPDLPTSATSRLVANGHIGAGRQLAAAARRAWWPLLLAAMLFRRTRPAVLAVLAQPVVEWRPGRFDPLSYVFLRNLDDFAYGVGVWQGAASTWSAAAMLPSLSGWPGKRSTGR
jgi:mycofactocin glycosyltransferase